MNKRPEKSEYAAYYEGYVSRVSEAEIIPTLENQLSEVKALFAEIPEEKGTFAYAEGKWTIKEMLGHINDGERVFAYRALRVSRDDKTPIAGFEQDDYVANSNFNSTSLADLTEEFLNLRQANIILFKNLQPEAWDRTGTASNNEVSVRALAYIMVGHIRHHFNIMKERYLS